MAHRPAVLSSQSPFRLHILLLFLLLLASSGLSYDIGDSEQCRSAHFVPGYNLLGESLDMVTYERKGVYPIDIHTFMSSASTCFLFRNIHQENQLQKVPYAVSLWTSETGCETAVRGEVHPSVSSLIERVKSQDLYDWKVGLNWKVAGQKIGGQYYDSYDFAKFRNEEDQFTFSSHWLRCSFYRLTVRNKPLLNEDFEADVKNLPRDYNSGTKDQYRQFIRKYGTHYISQVRLGGQVKRLAATRTCLARVNGISPSESKRCLSLDLQAGMGIGSVDSSCSKFLHNRDMKGHFSAGLYVEKTKAVGGNGWSGVVSSKNSDSNGYLQWKESLKANPMIVEFDKRPLYDLVNDQAKSGLADAINEYIKGTVFRFSDRKPSCSVPSHYSDCCPKYVEKGLLTVTIFRGWDLYGDISSVTEGYVEIFYGEKSQRTRMIESNNPQWNEKFNLGLVDAGKILKLVLFDEDPTHVDVLAVCCRYLYPSFLYPWNCKGKYGNFYTEFEFKCGPHLTGDNCNIYVPTEA